MTTGANDVIAAASRAANIPTALLLVGPRSSRRPLLIRFRAACAWILRERFKMSLPEIGAHLGYGDHTTVLHHLRTTCTRPDTMEAVKAIEDEMRVSASA